MIDRRAFFVRGAAAAAVVGLGMDPATPSPLILPELNSDLAFASPDGFFVSGYHTPTGMVMYYYDEYSHHHTLIDGNQRLGCVRGKRSCPAGFVYPRSG